MLVRLNSELDAHASLHCHYTSHPIHIPDRHDLPQPTMIDGPNGFSIRLRQRIALDAQQVRQVPPQYRPGCQRPYGLAELRRKRE